jgi:dihydroneopterin aldolase
LIETLAEEIADHVLSTFPVTHATVVVRKFILTDTASVRVELTKSR